MGSSARPREKPLAHAVTTSCFLLKANMLCLQHLICRVKSCILPDSPSCLTLHSLLSLPITPSILCRRHVGQSAQYSHADQGARTPAPGPIYTTAELPTPWPTLQEVRPPEFGARALGRCTQSTGPGVFRLVPPRDRNRFERSRGRLPIVAVRCQVRQWVC